jgi:hypothetical protein
MSDGLTAYLSSHGLLIDFMRPAIVALILFGLWIALRRTRLEAGARIGTWLAVAAPLVLWLTVIWTLASRGVFEVAPGGISPLPLAIGLPVLVAFVALTRSERIAAAVVAATPAWLVGLQAYRVIGGNFVVLWSFGAIPGAFALPAGIGDMLVGLLALPAAFYLASGAPGGRIAAIAWNILGIADLADAIVLGMLSSPGPFHILALDHPNIALGFYPTVMTPAFAVPLSLILHGISLWQLRHRARQPNPALAAAY